ncbi:hypothetical protein EYF80_041826 [Liparis tanakae]|uniref:Uncharacterized protein n=1 Tax=Liparis tanakae TaxID=230148 RepID=A0A4Z2G5A2_9TELE|nr:hypothetical protein EYF80_041826 [Liparis tanakae]
MAFYSLEVCGALTAPPRLPPPFLIKQPTASQTTLVS